VKIAAQHLRRGDEIAGVGMIMDAEPRALLERTHTFLRFASVVETDRIADLIERCAAVPSPDGSLVTYPCGFGALAAPHGLLFDVEARR